VKRVLVAFATTATLVAGAVAVVVGVGLFSGADDSIESDKPRPPQIVITR
jgi:hypothetical protein